MVVTTTFGNQLVTSKLALSNLGSSDVGKYQCSYVSPLDKKEKKSKEITLNLYGNSIEFNLTSYYCRSNYFLRCML